ncbi:hypothetical protein ACFLZV_06945 [Candidatus Margulisiibacteriota bacterium]
MLNKFLSISDQISVTDKVLKGVWKPKSAFEHIPNDMFINLFVPFLLSDKNNVFDIMGLLFASKYLFSLIIPFIEPRYLIKSHMNNSEIEKFGSVLSYMSRIKLCVSKFDDFNFIKDKYDLAKVTKVEINHEIFVTKAFESAVSILDKNKNLKELKVICPQSECTLVFKNTDKEIRFEFTAYDLASIEEDNEDKSEIYRILKFIAKRDKKKKKIIADSIYLEDEKFIVFLRIMRKFGDSVIINRLIGGDDDDFNDEGTIFNINCLKDFLNLGMGYKKTNETPEYLSRRSFEIDAHDMRVKIEKGVITSMMLHSLDSKWNEILKPVKDICSNVDFRIALFEDQLSLGEIMKELKPFKGMLVSLKLYNETQEYLKRKQVTSPESDFVKKVFPAFVKLGKDFKKLNQC